MNKCLSSKEEIYIQKKVRKILRNIKENTGKYLITLKLLTSQCLSHTNALRGKLLIESHKLIKKFKMMLTKSLDQLKNTCYS